jgi:hypothetical protein
VLDRVQGCTFDDYTLHHSAAPRAPRPWPSISGRLPHHLKRPLSRPTWTVTRADGHRAGRGRRIGIIDRGFRSGEIDPQVREVQIVKRKQHGVISDPYTSASRLAESRPDARHRVGTLVVVEPAPVGPADERDLVRHHPS